MALLRKKQRPEKPQQPQGGPDSEMRTVVGQRAHCRICDDYQQFTRCWLRTGMVRRCTCCGLVFENPAALYKMHLPACPKCGEFLEQAGFEYGLCDGCGSKYELMQGTKPSLLPNHKQRKAMNQVGRSRSK